MRNPKSSPVIQSYDYARIITKAIPNILQREKVPNISEYVLQSNYFATNNQIFFFHKAVAYLNVRFN